MTETTRRSVLAALAVAPAAAVPAIDFAGDPSEWERKLRDYKIKKALHEADGAFGAMADAERAHDYERMCREDRKGEPGNLTTAAATERLNAAENAYFERYTKAFWVAAVALVMTPAPTVEALVQKVAIIKEDEVWNDSRLPGEAMDYVLSDARRLMGRA